MKRCKGFSLIELMIVVAIVAIATIIAVPAYKSYVLKGKRSDAQTTLLAIGNAQEIYRISHTTYGTLNQVWNSTTTPKGYYTLSMTPGTPNAVSYTITATATGGQTADTECTTLSITVNAGVETKAPGSCW